MLLAWTAISAYDRIRNGKLERVKAHLRRVWTKMVTNS
jgi:hypothetical protein